MARPSEFRTRRAAGPRFPCASDRVARVQVLLVTLGSIGDLIPFLAVAERLRARGHACVIASNAGYAPLVQAAGFPFAVIWQRSQQSLDDVIRKDPARAWEAVRDQMF